MLFMIFGERTNQDVGINIGCCTVNNSQEEKLLGVLIDSNLNFEKYVSYICKKAGNKLFALSRISTYLGTDKLRLLMRAFVTSQFQYCPLVWIFHSSKMNNKINRLHERALRIAIRTILPASYLYWKKRWMCNNTPEKCAIAND